MENIIKKVVDIENSAKIRMNEIREAQQKNKDECREEFTRVKQEKYDNINKVIDAYRIDHKKILDLKIKTIANEQEKITCRFIDDFNARYDSFLAELYEKIIR